MRMFGDTAYIKVRLSDENGLNGERAWAYARKVEGINFLQAYYGLLNQDGLNYQLILDNNTAYFSRETELILSEDGYNVDMEATRQLQLAKAMIQEIKSISRSKKAKVTYKESKKLLKLEALQPYTRTAIRTNQGITELRDAVEHGLNNQLVSVEGVRKGMDGYQTILYGDLPYLEKAEKLKAGEYHSVWAIETYALEEGVSQEPYSIEVYYVPEEVKEQFYSSQYIREGYAVGDNYYFNPNPLFDIDYAVKIGKLLRGKFTFDETFVKENPQVILLHNDEKEMAIEKGKQI